MFKGVGNTTKKNVQCLKNAGRMIRSKNVSEYIRLGEK
jgi:hypothetical protein